MESTDQTIISTPIYNANDPHGSLRKIIRYLKKAGLYRLGTGDETVGKSPSKPENVNWLNKADKHTACLETFLGNHAADVILNDDPVDTWNSVIAFVGQQLGVNAALTYKELFNKKYDGRSGVEKHCKEVLAKRDALVHAGETVSENLTMAVILNSIPSGKDDPFYALHTAMNLDLSRKDSQATPSFIVSQLVAEETRLKGGNQSAGSSNDEYSSAIAMVNRLERRLDRKYQQRLTEDLKPPVFQSNPYCTFCDKGRHAAVACDVLFGQMLRYRGLMKMENLKKPQMNSLVTEGNEFSGDEDELVSRMENQLSTLLAVNDEQAQHISNDDMAYMGW